MTFVFKTILIFDFNFINNFLLFLYMDLTSNTTIQKN